MSQTNPVGQVDPLEILVEWQGDAIRAPGVLSDEKQVEQLAAGNDVPELTAWIAVTGLSSDSSNPVSEGLNKRIVGVLSSWRLRLGQAKIDEVKKELIKQLEQCRRNRKITDEELLQRVERLFSRIQS